MVLWVVTIAAGLSLLAVLGWVSTLHQELSDLKQLQTKNDQRFALLTAATNSLREHSTKTADERQNQQTNFIEEARSRADAERIPDLYIRMAILAEAQTTLQGAISKHESLLNSVRVHMGKLADALNGWLMQVPFAWAEPLVISAAAGLNDG